MSLPSFSTQSELFSTAGLSTRLFPETDRYRLFTQWVYPALATARAPLEKCYCADNGRLALEPVLMLGVSILQHLDGVPERQAVEMLRYHAGGNFALNRQLGDPVFHPPSLVHFRQRLLQPEQSALGFTTILDALEKAGWVSRQSRQRLDLTPMFGLVARMSRLDGGRESLRLALRELEPLVKVENRPWFWRALWERYVESQGDYRAGSETLARKLSEAGADRWQRLKWLREPAQGSLVAGAQTQLVARVLAEPFEVSASQPHPAPLGKVPLAPEELPARPPPAPHRLSPPRRWSIRWKSSPPPKTCPRHSPNQSFSREPPCPNRPPRLRQRPRPQWIGRSLAQPSQARVKPGRGRPR